MRHIILAGLFATLSATLPAASAFARQEQPVEAQHYSVETTAIGTLLDDPAAAAILERVVPTVYASDMFRTMGRPNTLRTASQYEADLTETKMQELQAEFDKIPAAAPSGE
ncbi:hypothetical protein GRI62_07280 [Erythrobacter arachoides]|uniref:Uncharacterized protein n=1 Tax=Aurantiacibacter arachoides TaxID=1850444 RepID=A0A845A2M4_9SPHN|nr:hypothetical protein [Aurantiacibacter arachoides]MXO93406.1 hypothetical protein [Aurantiacibacter arachoides]GGD49622.1 hypothetical protein GCM10011411_06760 [Aurantiacibacter arachoides]